MGLAIALQFPGAKDYLITSVTLIDLTFDHFHSNSHVVPPYPKFTKLSRVTRELQILTLCMAMQIKNKEQISAVETLPCALNQLSFTPAVKQNFKAFQKGKLCLYTSFNWSLKTLCKSSDIKVKQMFI